MKLDEVERLAQVAQNLLELNLRCTIDRAPTGNDYGSGVDTPPASLDGAASALLGAIKRAANRGEIEVSKPAAPAPGRDLY